MTRPGRTVGRATRDLGPRTTGAALRLAAAASVVVPFAFLLATYGWPLWTIVRRSFEGSSLRLVGDTLASARIGRIAWQTTAQAALSTLVVLAVGIPAAYCHVRFRYPGRRAMWLAVAVPFVLPTVVVSAGLLAVVGSDGLGRGDAGSWLLVVVAHVAVNLAVVVRTVAGRLASIDPRLEEVARSLGRNRVRAACVVVGAARDAIWGSAILVFLFCLTSFGIVLVLGGGAVTTMEVEIWYQSTRILRLDAAAVLALAQMVVVVVVLVGYQRSTRSRTRAPARVAGPPRRPSSWPQRAFVAGCVLVEGALVLTPVVALVGRSLRVVDGWGLDHFRHLGSIPLGTSVNGSPLQALWNSLAIGLIAALVAVGVGVPAAIASVRRRRGARLLDAALMLPLATSAATVGFGILLAYRQPPFDLRGSVLAVPLVEATIATPLVVRVLSPVLAALDRRQLDAAASLGAGGWRTLRVVVAPVVAPVLGVAAALAFAVSLGEFGATAFLARQDAPTLPQLIVRLLGRPGDANVGQAMALGAVLVLCTAGVFGAVEALGRGRALEF